jgi:hypothetical protein
MKKWILLLGVFFGGVVCAEDASAAADAVSEPIPPVRVQISVYLWPTRGILMDDARIPGVPRMFYSHRGAHVPLRLARSTATPLMPYEGELPLVLYDFEERWEAPPEDAPPGTPPVHIVQKHPRVRVNFPRNWDRVLLIVFPNRVNDDGTLVTIPLQYGTGQLPPGMARIHNSSDQTLLLNFPDRDQVLTLEAHQSVNFRPEGLTDTGFSRVFVHRRSSRGGTELVYTSRLFFEKDKTNFFLLYAQGPRHVRLMRLAGHAGDGPEILP